MNIRLLVVDDHEMVREGLRYVLGGREMEIVEAANGEAALRLVVEQEFDVVLLDVEMPVLDGLEALRRIKERRPDLPVLMHSCHDRIANIELSLELGAAGYLVKSPNTSNLIEAVFVALAGGSVWTPDQLRHVRNVGGASGY